MHFRFFFDIWCEDNGKAEFCVNNCGVRDKFGEYDVLGGIIDAAEFYCE